MISKRSIPFDHWKHKVDHHIRYLVGYDTQHLEHFLYRNYYDNDFSPKLFFLAVKNCHNLQVLFPTRNYGFMNFKNIYNYLWI